MANVTALRGPCPAPFFDMGAFSDSDGFSSGRFCLPIPGASSVNGTAPLFCCLPCPSTDYLYSDNFYGLSRIPGGINIASLFLSVFLLVSYAVLPAQATRRHYLNICMLLSIVFMALGFIVPWAKQPDVCQDQITPKGPEDSLTCAFGGAFVVAGGSALVSWILMRTISMHVQIVYDFKPGKTFFWESQVFGWAITAAITTVELVITGVSFRFGDYCHVNHHESLQTFWIPLLVMGGITAVLQIFTFAYCIKVYILVLLEESRRDSFQSGKSDLAESVMSSLKPRAVFNRMQRVLLLQWRGMTISSILVACLIYFCVVFVNFDGTMRNAFQNIDSVVPWIDCMIKTQNKDMCLPLATFVPKESVLIGVLCLLSVIGIVVFFILCPWSLFVAWADLFKRCFGWSTSDNDEDSESPSRNGSATPVNDLPSPDAAYTSPFSEKYMQDEPIVRSYITTPSPYKERPPDRRPSNPLGSHPTSPDAEDEDNFFGRASPLPPQFAHGIAQRDFFSRPIAPRSRFDRHNIPPASSVYSWDPRSTFANTGRMGVPVKTPEEDIEGGYI